MANPPANFLRRLKTEIIVEENLKNRIQNTEDRIKDKKQGIKFDGLAKSRHPGENRGPEKPERLENTGFRLSPE